MMRCPLLCSRRSYLIPGGVVYFRSYRLSLGLRRKQRLGFIEAEAEDLAVQLVILLPQLLVLLKAQGARGGKWSFDSIRVQSVTMTESKKSSHHIINTAALHLAGQQSYWGQCTQGECASQDKLIPCSVCSVREALRFVASEW